LVVCPITGAAMALTTSAIANSLNFFMFFICF
jgi:hypothetical protein